MNKIIFLHLALFPNCNESHFKILNSIKKSGLLNEIENVHIGVVGAGDVVLPYQDKIVIHRLSDDVAAHEFATAHLMWEFCQKNKNCQILKCHNAGVKQKILNNPDPKFPFWLDLEIYWLIQNYNLCLTELNNYDAVGIEYYEDPARHFSGSWYWSKSEVIANLPNVNSTRDMMFGSIPGAGTGNAHGVEMWLSLDRNLKMKSLYQTGYHWSQRAESVRDIVIPFLESLPASERCWEAQK